MIVREKLKDSPEGNIRESIENIRALVAELREFRKKPITIPKIHAIVFGAIVLMLEVAAIGGSWRLIRWAWG